MMPKVTRSPADLAKAHMPCESCRQGRSWYWALGRLVLSYPADRTGVLSAAVLAAHS